MLREVGYEDTKEKEAVPRVSLQIVDRLLYLHGQRQVEVLGRLEIFAPTGD